MLQETTNSILKYLNVTVTNINNVLNRATGNNSIIIVALFSIGLGFILNKRLNDGKGIHWWTLFSILFYMAFRFLGIGS